MILLTALGLLGWVLALSAVLTGVALLAAALLQLARLARWRGWRTAGDPLVLVLHLGYLWIPVGLGLLGCSILNSAVPRSSAVHALTAGAMATMILAVMTRASLGHTGRELRASRLTVIAYGSVTIGAILRVTAPLGLIDYRAGLAWAGMFWATAFVLFLAVYGPILLKPRLHG